MTTFKRPQARTTTPKASVVVIVWERCCDEYFARISLKMCRQVNFDHYAETCRMHYENKNIKREYYLLTLFPHQVEMLYQRYFLRMNQSNAVHIIWLLLGLVIILLIIYTANTFSILPTGGPCKCVTGFQFISRIVSNFDYFHLIKSVCN